MRLSGRTASIFFVLALLAGAAQAQPSEDCTNVDLGGSDSFPSGGFPVTVDDFTMSGSCAEQGVDSAVCFTTENDCTVDILCENDTGMQSINVFTGPCVASQSTCTASATGQVPSLTGFALTGGQNTCVVCEYSGLGLQEMNITETVPGACGTLPVELLSFEIEDSD
ncbi:MAG: hypothetical protein GY719_27040 [bacterium]|nr:hypothetical protein [bacterium]